MGTEKNNAGRTKPPPIPPRPQHLVPAKAMAKYSSMPDVLNGWRRDTNPDLLKSSGGCGNGGYGYAGSGSAKLSAATLDATVDRRNGGVVRLADGSAPQPQRLYAPPALKGGGRAAASSFCAPKCDPQRPAAAAGHRAAGGSGADDGGKAPSRKFSCIPSRSNSKKKKTLPAGVIGAGGCHSDGVGGSGGAGRVVVKSRSEISQTSWYVENLVDHSVVQLSKCEISLNSAGNGDGNDNDGHVATNCRYPETINRTTSSSSLPATLASTTVANSAEPAARTKTNFFRKLRHSSNSSQSSGSSNNNNSSSSGSNNNNNNSNSSARNNSKKATAASMAATSSSSLNGLPPLPKSLSDASLLWDPSDPKKLSSYSVNLSPSSSNASSSSRSTSSGSCGYPKAPLQTPSLSSSSRSGSVVFDNASASSAASSATKLDPALRDGNKRPPPPPPPRKPTSLDLKLATLRREMYDLRQMDLALLSQLWSLNEAIIEFRHMQVSPSSPSLHSSDEEDSGCYYSNVSSQGMVTSNQQSNTLGSNSSRSSISTNRSTRRENVKPS